MQNVELGKTAKENNSTLYTQNSKLGKLIQQYCPDGVEYVKLGEIANVCRGTRVVRSQLSNEGYPVYQNCLTPMGYFDKTNCPGGTPFVICGGAAGNVGYADVDCWAADDCEYIIASEEIISRYIYHCLMLKREYLSSKVRKASIPRLSPSIIKDLEIPLPPLPVQEAIVNILDRFAVYAAELQAELQARQQQYNYYRDTLLSFEGREDVQWKKLEDVFELRNGYTPSKNNPAFWNNGIIPWYRMEDIRENGRILKDSIQHITPAAVKGKGLFEANSFIIATTATIGEHALLIADSLANQQFTNLKIRESLTDKLDVTFVYYYLFVVDEFCKNHVNISGFASVDMDAFKRMQFPIPPLSEQQRIVDILDRFDTLVNDLSQGLPAEIEARRQQYEYYRDQLLTFKRKN